MIDKVGLVSVLLRVSPPLRSLFEKAAQRCGQSLNEWIIETLTHAAIKPIWFVVNDNVIDRQARRTSPQEFRGYWL